MVYIHTHINRFRSINFTPTQNTEQTCCNTPKKQLFTCNVHHTHTHHHNNNSAKTKNKNTFIILLFTLRPNTRPSRTPDEKPTAHRSPLAARRRRRINHEKFIVPVGCLRHVLLYNNNNNIANKCVCILNKQTNKC